MPNKRIAVVGGVAAGPRAAAVAQRTSEDAEVVLYEQGPRISYGACEMPYYVADWIEEAETLVVLSPEEFEESRGATVRVHHRVQEVDTEQGRLVVENTETGETTEDPFDECILCTGASARVPDGVDTDLPNVFAVRRLQDVVGIKEELDEGDVREAVILGGGYIGVEMAEALRERGVSVTILEPAGGLLNQYLDEDMRPLIHEVVRENDVTIREAGGQSVVAENGRARAVVTSEGDEIKGQLVLVAMGVEPNTALAEAAGAEVGETGALAVDDAMRTGVDGLWACGDCVQVERVVDGEPVHLPLSPVAYRTARVAARNAAQSSDDSSELDRFAGVCVTSAVKVFDWEVAAVGLRLDEAREAGFDAVAQTTEHWSRVAIYPGAEKLHVRYVAERSTGRLLGAELAGPEGVAHRADVLVPLIREGWSLERIYELDLVYAPPFAPAMDPLLVAARNTMKQLS
jgi:NADPH-dependent 2,4-dienoyl-CoA reductase/sulfur reductase-like enzyme